MLVVPVGSLLLAKLTEIGGDAVIRRLTTRIPGQVDDVIFRTLHPPLYVTVLLVGVFVALALFSAAAAWLVEIQATLSTLLTVMWVYSPTRMGRRVSERATAEDRFDNQVVPIFQNVWTAVVLGAGIFLVLRYWRINVTPLLASAGILGIVVGLAARDTIANFFGSIALYADRTYTVGDYIVLESGECGRVEDISIRSTVIRTRDDILVTVPNSVLNTATIVDESEPQRERRVRIPVGVAYGTDLDHPEEVLLGVAERERLVIDDPSPRVRVRGFGESTVDMELLCWVTGPVLRGRVSHRLFEAIYTAFRDEDIEIPFPQRVVSMTDGETDADHDSPVQQRRDPDPVGSDRWADTADSP